MDFDEIKDYKYILDKFGREVVAARCDWLVDAVGEYIRQEKLEGSVSLSEEILFPVVIDYFVDIDRLKDFQNIETTNMNKIFAYLSYWFLRHKPLQVSRDINPDKIFVNEDFCANLIRCYLFDNPPDVPIRSDCAESINEFLDTMVYYFKYRDFSAKSIEFMLMASWSSVSVICR